MAKYKVYWYAQNGSKGMETFSMEKKDFELLRQFGRSLAIKKDWHLKEFAIYDSRDVLLVDEQWDSKKKRWKSLIKNKKEDYEYGMPDNWHPFGL